jgi:hypothetical protein
MLLDRYLNINFQEKEMEDLSDDIGIHIEQWDSVGLNVKL